MSSPSILILDVDGTLNIEYPSKVINRNQELVKKNPYGAKIWDLFEASTKNMEAKPQFLPYYYSKCFRKRFKKIYVITARLDKWRPQTEKWLKKWGISYDEIYLRPSELMSLPSHEVKEIIINKYILNRHKPREIVACDDELGICNMYRSYGIKAYQVPVDWEYLIEDLKFKYPKLSKEQRPVLEYYLIKEYKKGKTLKEVAKELGYNYRALIGINKELLQNNKKINSSLKRYKRVDIESFKRLDNEIAAYVTGFAATNGVVEVSGSSATLRWQVNSKDEEILTAIKSALKAEQKVIRKDDHSSFSISQLSLINLLIYRWGIVPNKSINLKFPFNLPRETIHHFLRGVFDGHGTFAITDKKKDAQFEVYSQSIDFVKGLSKVLNSFGIRNEIKKQVDNRTNPIYKVKVLNRCADTLYKFLYKNSKLYLKRKKLILEKYLKMLEED